MSSHSAIVVGSPLTENLYSEALRKDFRGDFPNSRVETPPAEKFRRRTICTARNFNEVIGNISKRRLQELVKTNSEADAAQKRPTDLCGVIPKNWSVLLDVQ